MRKLILLVATALLFGGTSAGSQEQSRCVVWADSPDSVMCLMKNAEVLLTEIHIAAVGAAAGATQGCESPLIKAFEEKADALDENSGSLRLVSFKQSPEISRMILRRVELSTQVVAGLRVDLADFAMTARCFDLADSQYRTVVRKYSGPSVEHSQRRAFLGIEDLREIRIKSKQQ